MADGLDALKFGFRPGRQFARLRRHRVIWSRLRLAQLTVESRDLFPTAERSHRSRFAGRRIKIDGDAWREIRDFGAGGFTLDRGKIAKLPDVIRPAHHRLQLALIECDAV